MCKFCNKKEQFKGVCNARAKAEQGGRAKSKAQVNTATSQQTKTVVVSQAGTQWLDSALLATAHIQVQISIISSDNQPDVQPTFSSVLALPDTGANKSIISASTFKLLLFVTKFTHCV